MLKFGPEPIESFNKQMEELMQQIGRSRQRKLQQQQLEETAKYHGADIGLRKEASGRAAAASGRAAALAPLQKLLLESKLETAQHANDPMYDFNKYQKIRDAIAARAREQSSNEDVPVKTDKLKDMFQGKGMFGLGPEYEEDQTQTNPEQKQSGPTPEEIDNYYAYKQVGMTPPQLSSSGITANDRIQDRQIKIDAATELARHHRELEKIASPEHKKVIAEQLAKIETIKKKLQAEQKAEVNYNQNLDKEDAKIYGKMQSEAVQGIGAEKVLNEAADIVKNPVFEEIRQHPYLGHMELSYYKKSGTKAQQDLANRYESTISQLVAATAKGLNTRFTDKDLALAQQMKISPNDSFEGAKAKLESLMFLHKIGQQRADKALELIRKERLTPLEALKRADKDIDGNQIRKMIHAQIHNTSNIPTAPKGMTMMLNKYGAPIPVPNEDVANAPKGWTRVKL